MKVKRGKFRYKVFQSKLKIQQVNKYTVSVDVLSLLQWKTLWRNVYRTLSNNLVATLRQHFINAWSLLFIMMIFSCCIHRFCWAKKHWYSTLMQSDIVAHRLKKFRNKSSNLSYRGRMVNTGTSSFFSLKFYHDYVITIWKKTLVVW